MATVATPARAEQEPQPAERIGVHYDSGSFALAWRMPLNVVLPPSVELPAGPVSGHWYELQASDGSVRYRIPTRDPVLLVFEGPAAPGGDAPSRVEALPLATDFSVIVPAPHPHDQLVLFGPPPQSSALRGGPAAEELFRLDLGEQP